LWSLVSILYSVVFSKIVTVEDIQKTIKKENMGKNLMNLAFSGAIIATIFIPILISLMLFMNFLGGELQPRETVVGVIEECDIKKLKDGYFIGIMLKDDNNMYRYNQPKKYSDQIKKLCFQHDRVEIKYAAKTKKLGKKTILYWIVGIKSLNSNKTIFSEEDYEEWEKKNKNYGIILLSIFLLIFLFALTIVIIRLKKRKKRVAG